MHYKLKRASALLICLCLIVGSVLLFSSCGKKKVDLATYTVVYDGDVSEATANKIKQFAEALTVKTGYAVEALADSEKSPAEDRGNEILVGSTTRIESAQALASIEGHGYAISVIGNKIVLNGTTNLFATMAMDRFAELYMTGETLSKVSVAKEEISSNMETVTIGIGCKVLYPYRISASFGYEWGDKIEENPDAVDLPALMAQQVRKTVANATTEAVNLFKLRSDSGETAADEILVGLTNRAETTEFIQNLGVNDYGLYIKNGKIGATGLNDQTLRDAAALLKGALADSRSKISSNITVVIPTEYSYIVRGEGKWISDFPRPSGEGIHIAGSVDVHDGSMQYCYEGDGINATAYENYCKVLKDAGYSVLTENQIGENRYCTFVNKSEKITLHVVYNAYAYTAEQKLTSMAFEPSIRIIAASTKSVNLPDESILKPDGSYQKVTESKITSVGLEWANGGTGSGYIVTLEDGSFIVVDGGDAKNKKVLWNALSDLHTTITGNAPSTKNPIKITAWYLTHAHGDHYRNFFEIATSYGQQMRVKYLIGNFPSDDEIYNTYDPNPYLRDNFSMFSNAIPGGVEYVKVHAGQKLYFCNVEMEILYTHEDLYPWTIEYFNDTSTVARMTFYSTNGNGISADMEKSTDMLWLGDAQFRVSKHLRATYGNLLQTEMVQISHHGSQGCEWELYELVAPSYLWWPIGLVRPDGQVTFTDYISNANHKNEWYRIDYKLFYEMKSVKFVVLGDEYNLTVTIGADGPNFNLGGTDGVYNAGSSTPIAYDKYFIKK